MTKRKLCLAIENRIIKTIKNHKKGIENEKKFNKKIIYFKFYIQLYNEGIKKNNKKELRLVLQNI